MESESKNNSNHRCSDSSESWNRNRFWLMSMVESQSESSGIELELWVSEILNRDGV